MTENKLYRMIQQVSFTLYETALYLDTHPTCRQALRYFEKQSARLHELVEQYERNHGPMTHFGHVCGTDSWKWVSEPWPWEYDCR